MKKTNYLFLIFLFFGLLILYRKVSFYFDYWGFTFDIIHENIFFSIFLIFVLNKVSNKLFKNDLIYVFIKFWLVFVILPILVLYSSGLISFNLTLAHLLFYFLFLIFTNFKRSISLKEQIFPIIFLSFKNNKILLLFFVILLMLPLYSVFSNFNLNSFSLKDIYDVRVQARADSNLIIGYLREPLARVVFPFLMIYGLKNNLKLLVFIGFSLIIMIYASTGALKSILAVIPVSIIFYSSSDYFIIIRKILIIVTFLVFIPILENIVFDTFFIGDLPSRRLFFVPGLMENAYLEEFKNSFQFYQNSFLKFFNENSNSITNMIGAKYFSKPDMNANVGVVTDGFINIGFIGVAFHSFIIYLILAFINSFRISPKYFGIFFVYFYYFNTSFLSTLLFTHGLIFLVFFLFIFREFNNKKKLLS